MDLRCPACGLEFELADENRFCKVLCPCGNKFIADERAMVPPAGAAPSRPLPAQTEVKPPSAPLRSPSEPAVRAASPGTADEPSPLGVVAGGTRRKTDKPRTTSRRAVRSAPVTATRSVPRPTGPAKWLVLAGLTVLVVFLAWHLVKLIQQHG